MTPFSAVAAFLVLSYAVSGVAAYGLIIAYLHNEGTSSFTGTYARRARRFAMWGWGGLVAALVVTRGRYGWMLRSSWD